MPRVRYTDDGGRYRVAGETFEPGDDAEVSEGLASHLVDDVGRFERIASDDGGDSDGDDPDAASDGDSASDAGSDDGEASDDEGGAPFHPGEYTVGELEERVASGDYSDAELEALAEAERANDDRTTAIEAIEEA